MDANINIPRHLAINIVKHLTDAMTTDESHIIFDTPAAHTEVIEDTAKLFAHIINQTR